MPLSPTSSHGSGGASALTLISTTTLGSVGTFDLTALPQTYNDLIVVGVVRGTAAAIVTSLNLTINADTGAHYDFQTLAGAGNVASASESFAQVAWLVAQVAAAGSPANVFSYFELVFPGYASTVWEKVGSLRIASKMTASTFELNSWDISLFWRSTAAISRLTLIGSGSPNFEVGSQLRVYGRT